jgi:probable F420-dependent oxidoreductase
MRIGVVFPQTEFGNDVGAIRAYAQTVEGLGFRHILAYDHVLGADLTNRPDWKGNYSLKDPFHEIFVLFAFWAGITERIEFVSGVLVLPQRQTALVAKQAAELDLLSGGRLRLGVGVGWNQVEYEGLGMDFHTRGARADEQIRLLRELWGKPSVTFEGRWDRLEGVGISPMPVQRPIPIWIGGYVDRTLRRVAELGDGWFPEQDPNDHMKMMVSNLRTYVAGAGRDFSEIGMEPQLNVGQRTPDDWRWFVDGWKDLGATHVALNTMRNGYETPQQHLDALERAARELGVGPTR